MPTLSPVNANPYPKAGVPVWGARPEAASDTPKAPMTAQEKKAEAEAKKRMGIRDASTQCQTCKNRKYKDGSNEAVSFKSPTRISPANAGAVVRSHEQEHVSNAYSKAASAGGKAKVVSATVSIRTAICPECGRSYVSGGTTKTQIKYYNEANPYQQDLKAADYTKYAGMNLNMAV